MFIRVGDRDQQRPQTVTMIVENAGDRPIQVGSHFHFAAANPALWFDRKEARGTGSI